jgi:hypothetical protein
MLSSINPINLDEVSRIFTVGSPPIKIADPFCKDSGLLGERLLKEDNHFPILLAECSSDSSTGLLIFLNRKDIRLTAWEVKLQDRVNHARHIQCSRVELALLLSLSQQSTALCQECIHESTSKAPRWAQNASKDFVTLLTDHGSTRSLARPSRALTNIAFRNYIGLSNLATGSLLDYIENQTQSPKKELIKLYFIAYTDQVGNHFSPSFSYTATYCALRELYTFITGEYITIDPLTKQHTTSCSARALRTSDGNTSRLIKYHSPMGPTYIERRGPAWLDVTSQIIFCNGLIVNIKSGQQWGSIEEDELRFIRDYLSESDNTDNTPKPVHLYIDIGGKNLGHLLWNELSGYIEFNRLAKVVGYVPAGFTSSLPPPQSNLFSQAGIRSYLQPYIKKAINRLPHNASAFLDSSIADMHFLQSEDFVHSDRFSLVSFRYPRLSSYLVQAIQDDYPSHSDQESFRIYINIRSHNKCHSNLVECIDVLLDDLGQLDSCDLNSVSLDLEYFAEDDEQVPKVSDLCHQRNIQCNHHVGYEIPQLLELVSHSSICISPIGSGAISPTWIFNKLTVVHGDRRHMGQLKWWSDVGGSRSNIFPIPASEISDDYDKFYSNYRINPKAYSKTIIKCYNKFYLSRY